MIQWVPIEELQVGMYVILDLSWHEHPFLKNEFLIGARHEIEKIQGLGLPKVKIDTSKSDLNRFKARAKSEGTATGPAEEEDDILTVIHDPSLEANRKAGIVRKHTTQVIKNLFDAPSRENIKTVKKEAAKIVDLILQDEKTTFYLVSLTHFDFTTYNHSVNVGFLSIALANVAFHQSYAHDFYALGAGFFLHDIGKVKVDPAIINKPGPLTADEMKIMKNIPNWDLNCSQKRINLPRN